MSEVNWDAVAAATEGKLPEALGHLERLRDQGRLRRWLIVLDWDDENNEGFNRCYFSHPVDGMGLAEFAKNSILKSYSDDEDVKGLN